MRKFLLMMTALAVCNVSLAQVGATAEEGAKASAEKAKELGDDTKAAVSSQPNRSINKAKAHAHKAKAHYHAHKAKHAAKQVGK